MVLNKRHNKQVIFDVEFIQRQIVIRRMIDLEAQVKELKSHNKAINQQTDTLGATI